MISSRILKCINFNFKTVIPNWAQYRHIRKANRSIELDNSKEPEQTSLIKDFNTDVSKYESTPEKSQLIRNEYLKDTNVSESDFLDDSSLAQTDKQSKQLAKLVPKESYIATFNLAAYVNKSETLQKLLKLGVDLSKVEKRKGIGQFVLQLDFERDVKSHLTFLHDVGVPADRFGEFLTKNPLIFKVRLDDLKTRINYLEAKNFKTSQIQRICTLNPYWLMFSTKRIDKRLGYFQQNFKLNGDDTRHLATKQPRLITYKMNHVRENTFSIKEEMGFNKEEIRCLLLSKPKLWMMNHEEIIERFYYIHNIMKLSHDLILQFPEILTSRRFRVKERHEFLKFLGKAQYDSDQDKFISPKKLVEGTDEDFIKDLCQTNMEEYEKFLRKL